MRIKWMLAVCTCVFLMTLTGCSDKSEWRILVIGPMQTDNGDLLWKSVEMAADEINREGGMLKRKIKLIAVDDQNKADEAVGQLRQAIEQHHPHFMVGGNSSGVVLALMDVMAEHKIVWLGTGGALTNVVERIEKDYARYKYYFRVGTTDSAQQAKAIGQFALDVLGPNYGMRRFAVLGTDLQWARSALATASQMLEENGFEKTWEGFFPSNTTRFDSWFRQAEESGAEFILNYTLGGEGLSYIRQYHDLHVPLPIIGNHALSTRGEWWQETEGKTVWDMHFRFSGGDVALTPKTRPFLKAFLERYGVSPGFLSWPGYDALYILREAVQQAKSSESNSVIAQLEKLEYEGNVGYRFDARHDLTYGEADGKRYVVPVYFQWKPDGALRAVWPPEVAEAEYELPDWIQEKREP